MPGLQLKTTYKTLRFKLPLILKADLADGSRIVGKLIYIGKDERDEFMQTIHEQWMCENPTRGLVTVAVLSDVLGEIRFDATFISGLSVNGEVVDGIKAGNPLAVLYAIVDRSEQI